MGHSRIKKLLATALSAAVTLSMLPGATVPAQGATDDQPTPVIRFDMESLSDSKLINSATGGLVAVSGNAQLDAGKEGEKALRLDGTTYIDLGTEFQPASEYTMMGWIKQDAGATDGQAIFARGNSGDVTDQMAMLVKGGSVYHSVSFSSGTQNNQYNEFSAPGAPAEKWNHIAITRSGKIARIYINGKMVQEKINLPDTGFVASTKHLFIGMDCNGSGALYSGHAYQGLMDDLRLYDTALGEEAVKAIYAETGTTIAIEKTENGKLTLRFAKAPAAAPEAADFTIQMTDGDRQQQISITAFAYDSQQQTVTLSFEPLINHTNVQKDLQFNVLYGDELLSTQLTLSAGDNQSPTAENLTVENLSPKLGEEPHVKGMLKVGYTYADPDNDAEGETKYQWYVSDTPDGAYEKLQGINTKTIILLDKYVGKYLKCEVKPVDCFGNAGAPVMSAASSAPVQETEGNPLTDWMLEAGYGISHHFLANYFNADDVCREEREKWDIAHVSWNDFISQFDVEKYAAQVNETGAKFVTLTLGQNNGYYCAPNSTYDRYMREAGLLQEGQLNPMTTTEDFDLPLLLADALGKYGIKLMLYLPANPPHSAHWNTEGSSGYGFIGNDYQVTTKVFDYTPGSDGVPSQKARKVVQGMVREWSERYGDKIAGWWFDGVFSGGLLEGHTDMSLEYNIAGLANAAKAGNPYSIVTFNPGLGAPRCFEKTNDYQDYTSGENGALAPLPEEPSRWAKGTDDCQNYTFGVLGATNSWKGGWGCKGTSKTTSELITKVQNGLAQNCVMGMDTRVNVFGEIDPDQFAQLVALRIAVRDGGNAPDVEEIQLDKASLTLQAVGDRGILKPTLLPLGSNLDGLKVYAKDEGIVEIRKSSDTYDIIALAKGTTKICFESVADPSVKTECEVAVNGRAATKIIDNTDEAMTYSEIGNWYAPGGRPADPDGFYEYNRTVHASKEEGASGSFTFTGTGFDVISGYNTDQGKVSIQVDDQEPVLIDLSVPNGGVKKAFGLNVYGNYNLTYGTHTVKMTNVSSGKYIIIDAFRVYDEHAAGDPAKLQGLVNDLSGKQEADYTPTSWADFYSALTDAQALLEKTDATQEALNAAYNALLAASEALTEKADFTALNRIVEEYGTLNEKDYTAESWSAFQTVLAEAKTVLGNADATQGVVDNAYNNLVAARIALVELIPADKTELDALIAATDKIDTSNSRPGKLAAYKDALAHAKEISEKADATQEEVNAASDALLEAIVNLKDIVDKTNLNNLMNTLSQLKAEDYTAESFAVLTEALAQAALIDDDSSVAEVTAAYKGLQAANAQLVRVPKVNKEALANAIKKAQIILDNLDSFKPNSVIGLQEALNKAQAVYDDPAATQAEVKEATDALTAANAKAQVKEDKEVLFKAIEKAEALNAKDYTAESFAELTRVLAAAKLVAQDDNAGKEQVAAAAKSIESAIAGLQKAGDGSGNGSSQGGSATTGDSNVWPVAIMLTLSLLCAGYLLRRKYQTR